MNEKNRVDGANYFVRLKFKILWIENKVRMQISQVNEWENRVDGAYYFFRLKLKMLLIKNKV